MHINITLYITIIFILLFDKDYDRNDNSEYLVQGVLQKQKAGFFGGVSWKDKWATLGEFDRACYFTVALHFLIFVIIYDK